MVDYEVWIEKAKDDLLWAKSSLDGNIWYGTCFVAQQAAEKALKSYLVAKGEKLKKIHDVKALLDDCIKFDESLVDLEHETDVLYPHYTETRYPDWLDTNKYTEDDATVAYQSAIKIVERIEKLVS